MDKLTTLIEFIKFTHEIRNIEREMLLERDDRHENDAEHGYQLALAAWFLIENDTITLDKYRCVGMALVHDIVEVHAGDTFAFASPEVLAAKGIKEKEAVAKLKEQWPTFTSLHELIDEYEACETAEAKFVYALDKLLPMINNYLYEGKAWKKHGLTFERMKSVKVGKVDVSSEVNEYYQELLKLLEQKPDFFGVAKG